jgi:hypothetical protein
MKENMKKWKMEKILWSRQGTQRLKEGGEEKKNDYEEEQKHWESGARDEKKTKKRTKTLKRGVKEKRW